MSDHELDIELLLSLPTGSAGVFPKTEPLRAAGTFVASDPPGQQLGSGGGTAYVVAEAWRSATDAPFEEWLRQARKMVIHGSGQSRRLPGYATAGKPLIPIPPLDGHAGQRPDQNLLDLQAAAYGRIFWHAPSTYRLMVTCGDVLIKYRRSLPRFPEADILIVGLGASYEEAQRHGVMVCPVEDPERMAYFLQKPMPDVLQKLSSTHTFYLDTGIWMFSERAVMTLMRKCGWDPARDAFTGELPDLYDMFDEFGPALGTEPSAHDTDVSALTCAVLPVPDGRFYHFGTNRSVMGSVSQLQRPSADTRAFGHTSLDSRTQPSILNADVGRELAPDNRLIWIENSTVPASWTLSQRHMLTGIPPNTWTLQLEPGACLDMAPVIGGGLCARCYGFDDTFKGAIGDSSITWMDRPVTEWLRVRGMSMQEAGLTPDLDIQKAPLFPLLDPADWSGDFLNWLLTAKPQAVNGFKQRWLQAERLSAADLLQRTDIAALKTQRLAHMARAAAAQNSQDWIRECGRLDLAATADLYEAKGWDAPDTSDVTGVSTMLSVHDSMFRAAISAKRGNDDEQARYEEAAFGALRKIIVDEMEADPVHPVKSVLDDQIVWGRSPIRLDLAGGWTDTPPTCMERGGRVVNLAVNLNGQPPIQVFGRICEKPELVLRSIDLGIDQRVCSYDELREYSRLGSGFAIARAAAALAGLEPRFHVDGGYTSLAEHLMADFGGGIELSMVCAIPKGSGLGTSSILAATLLGTLSELCGLHWDHDALFKRTSALEQMLTSGGGWQDQAGGITRGIKLIETKPGIAQDLVVRWLPEHFFSGDYANNRVLLYYTGLTRVAHDILGEIVRGLFLNSAAHLGVIDEIRLNCACTTDAIQREDWDDLCEAVRRSWRLNRMLDGGTCPEPVRQIVDRIEPYASAYKLLGAGGGGYMLIFAEDEDAARRMKQDLTDRPPNTAARFVDLELSSTGLQVTRS